MKKLLFILIALTFILSAKGQATDTIKRFDADTVIFSLVEHPPEFVGGQMAFNLFLKQTIRYPAVAFESRIQGTVILNFIVEKDGFLSRIKVVRSVSPEIDAEALRVIKLSPKWKPGLQNGYVVRVFWTIPISFMLAGK